MELLKEGAGVLGISLSPGQLEAFETYYRELVAWNEKVNLTAITDYRDVQTAHFLDSLSCLRALPEIAVTPGRVADVGSGAGFPGLPLKIALPRLRLSLIEARGKKAKFLEHLSVKLGLDGVEVLSRRAEEVGHMQGHREGYDLCLARAITATATLAEYCLPLLAVGGWMAAYKGKDPSEEVSGALGAISLLGGELEGITRVEVPHLEGARHVVLVRKVSPTPVEYPRRPGIPIKHPLG